MSITKRKIALTLVLMLIFSFAATSRASAAITSISGAVLNDQLQFEINGETVVPVGDDGTPVLPITYNGTTYLPVRAMGYLLGLGIDWDSPTYTVILTSATDKSAPTPAFAEKTNSLIPISGALLNGNLNFSLDGETVIPIDDDGNRVLPISYNGTTYLPVRAFGYLLGLGIDWDGATRTVLITKSSIQAGWYYIKYIYYSSDGSVSGSFLAGDHYTDTSEGAGKRGNLKITIQRTYEDGDLIASGCSTTQWTDPPEFFSGTDRPSFDVSRVNDGWGLGTFGASIDEYDIKPGYTTSSSISFLSEAGDNCISDYTGTMQAEDSRMGSTGDKIAVILNLGNGYGFVYYYEWRQ